MKNKKKKEEKGTRWKSIGYIFFEVNFWRKNSLVAWREQSSQFLSSRCYPPLLPKNKMLDLVHLDSILNGATMTKSHKELVTRGRLVKAKLHGIMQSKLDRAMYIRVNPFENKRVKGCSQRCILRVITVS